MSKINKHNSLIEEWCDGEYPLLLELMQRLDMSAQVGAGEYIDADEIKKNLKKTVMAVEAKENLNSIYLRPLDGAFRKYVKESTATSVVRLNKGGKQVNEELFKSASGKLKKIYVYEQDFEDITLKMLCIYLKEDSEKEFTVIQTPFKQSFAQTFLMRLLNIDLSKSVKLKPYTIKNDEKSIKKGKDVYDDMIIPYQNDVKVNSFWNKDDKGKKPYVLPDIEIKNDKKGNFVTAITIERDEFLEDLVKNINEKLKVKDPEFVAATNNVMTADINKDDLPF